MSPETFLEKFDLITDAPGAVAKMRELILQLAVQGRLADAAKSDEPVADFLNRIWSDKSDSRFQITNAEKAVPFDIPSHWHWVFLSEVAEFSIGKTPPRGETSYWHHEDHSWVSIADMKHYETITETKEKVSALAAKDVFRNRFVAPGSILMSFKLTIGKVARTGIPCFHNEAIISLLPPEPELNDFLFRFLPLFAALQTSNNAIKGNTLNKGLLTLLPVALPPLAEQKRIVAKVDELMALCDRLEQQQNERETQHAALSHASLTRFSEAPTPENLHYLFHPTYTTTPADLRKTILTLAVQGKLVSRNDSDGIGLEILNKANVSEELTDNIPELPAHWAWARLGNIATRMDSGWSPACNSEPSKKTEWGVLKTTAVQTLQYLEEQNKALPPNLEPRPEHEVMDGDILFTRAGPMNRVGILCVARPTRKKLMISDKIIRFHLVDGIDPDFAALGLNAGHSSDVIEGLKSGMAASQVNISQPKLKSVLLPIPPLSEQKRIVAKVDELMKLVDQLEKQLTTARTIAENLLNALLADLTSQKAA